jgi:glycosyltransferase involved in cell wall biosynthesis
MQPKLSFVIPTRNCAVWLPHAVQSCRQQTENDIEIIVINDSSTDSTRDYLAWLIKEEPRAIVHHFDANLGRCAARNAGNAMAKAPIIAVLDADDIAYPNRPKLTLKKMETVDFAYGSAEVMGPLGNKLGTLSADVFNKDNALKTLENKIVHSTCAYHKRVIQTYKY